MCKFSFPESNLVLSRILCVWLRFSDYVLVGANFEIRPNLEMDVGKTYEKMRPYKGSIFQLIYSIQVYMSISISPENLSFSHIYKNRRNSGIFS